ncbi:MAG: LPS assembly protein LptD [Candidatus Omnitrophota bacterium]|jgi:lipopolysaccharide assembly outer membrane protein LptD (OstA)
MEEIFRKKAFIVIVFILLFCFPHLAHPQEKVLPVEINGDEINYVQTDGTIFVKGNVKMKYKDMVLTSDEANYNATTNIANIKGNVKIVRKDTTIYGEAIVYNFNSQEAKMVNMRMVSPPIYGKAASAGSEGPDKYTLSGGYITTCDLEKPHYKLMAKQIIAYPKVKVVAKNVVMTVGKIPVFYFPYLSVPLKDKTFPFMIVPGKSGDWGYYVLGRYRYHLNDKQRGRLILDWYEKRGVGVGVNHYAETEKVGKASANFYYLNDELNKPKNRSELFDKYPERKDLDDSRLPQDRYKAQFSHTWKPTEQLSLLSEFNKFSDEFFMKDFFQKEYDIDPHPLSYNLATYSFSNSTLSLLTQGRANKFFDETEYLPQMQYDFYQQNLGSSNLYLTSKTTAGSLSQKNANTDDGYSSQRAHTHNVLNYPKTFGWLYLNPYVGNYSTFYSKNLDGSENIFRTALETGMDFSTKVYKTFDVDFKIFGKDVDEMRHIITPRISYNYITKPSVSKDSIYSIIKFDEIDNLKRTQTVTVALENKLQAKNEDRTWDFIYFSPSLTYQVDKRDKRGQLDRLGTYLDTIQADLEFYPVEGISLKGDAQYDKIFNAFREGNLDVTFSDTKNKKYTVSIGQRYVREYNYDSDSANYSSQGTLDFNYQLTPKLQFKNYTRYEFKSGKFLEQQYALRKDLHCWWLDVGVDVDKQREGVTDLTFWVAFTLKDFPDLHIGFDQTYSGAKKSY